MKKQIFITQLFVWSKTNPITGNKIYTKVFVKSNGKEKWIEIKGFNPFPFKRESKLYTSKKVFNDWMITQGFEKEFYITDCFADKEKIVIEK